MGIRHYGEAGAMTRCWVCREALGDPELGVCADCGRRERFTPLRRWASAVTVALLGCAVLIVLQLRAATAALDHVAHPPVFDGDLGRPDSVAELEERRAVLDAQREELLAADERVLERVGSATVLLTLAVLVTAVLFVLWQFRARDNADLFMPRRQRMNRAQLVAGWLVPGAQLVAPRLAARDIWVVSQPAGGRAASRAWYETWWVLWAVAGAASYVTYWQWWEEDSRAIGYLTDGGQLVPAAAAQEGTFQWLFAVGLLLLATAAAAIAWVWRLTLLQETTRSAGPPPGPRPPDPRHLSQDEIVRRLAATWRRERSSAR
jgi:hypothetical protein